VIACDAVVVGGGPAGSTCARRLRLAGWDVIVIDRAKFPRDKVCAGWLTPGVFSALDLDPDEYRATGLILQEIHGFRTGVMGRRLIDTGYARVVSYAVRRCEFDDYLLRRAMVRVIDGTPITRLERTGDRWVVNGEIAAPVLVGAGGHFCPVARHLRGGADAQQPVVAKEAEFPVTDESTADGCRPELFFCHDLEGYGWRVRKGNYLNIGIGRRDPTNFTRHLQDFVTLLEATGTPVRLSDLKWRGHAYFASGIGPRPLVSRGAILVGDAAGLAYPESGEGICPAIESGRLGAQTLIAAGGRYDVEALCPYADLLRRRHPPARTFGGPVRAAIRAAGRLLLGSPAFTRHVVLDRWFLRVKAGLRGRADCPACLGAHPSS
jgi:geranylgeranyl reductase family protein